MNVAVFCGSSIGTSPAHADSARALGGLLARNGHRLIYGGGRIGLMGALADAVLEDGGEVIGIIPAFLAVHEVAHTTLTELVVVESMHERKRQMSDFADAFVILGGGFGTLDELFEILTWKQLGLHDKPIAVVNVGGLWDGLGSLVGGLLAQGFIREGHRELFTLVRDAAAALDAVENAPRVRGSIASKLASSQEPR